MYLQKHYEAQLQSRYKLKSLTGLSEEALLEEVGKKRGALQARGVVNRQKAAEIILHDFRSGILGSITLERPEEFADWLAHGEKLDAERQIKKDAIELDRLIRFKKIPRPAKLPPSED
jgi:ribosome biogenesis GTPase A